MNLTILITASLNPTHPKIDFIQKVILSLEFVNIKSLNYSTKIPVLLCHDAINPIKHYSDKNKLSSDKKRYDEYFINLEKFIKEYNNNSNFFNLIIIKNDKWGHLTGNLRNAIKYVHTEFMLVLQHDLPFCKSFDINSIIEDMKNNPQLKHIQFNRHNNLPIHWWKDKYNFFNSKNIKTDTNHYVSTLAWADQNQLTTKKYYTDLVLKKCKDGCFMEAVLYKKNNSPKTHSIYGTYFFGKYNESKYITHIPISTFWKGKYKIS